MSQTLEDIKQQLKPYLRQYLKDNGVEIIQKGHTDSFRCINPDHPDKNPSSGFVKGSDDQQFHCFSCLSSGDIFTAANHLEGKPLHGLPFVKENLEYLANKFSVPFTVTFTDEQLEAIKIDYVYEEAYKMLHLIDKSTGQFRFITPEHTDKRGWNEQTCKKIGVSTILDYDLFVNHLSTVTKVGVEDLKRVGIRPTMFGPDYITITIKDHRSRVKGFVSRYLKWTRGSTIPKYCNTSVSDNPSYHKDKLLFCLDMAKQFSSLRLDIFEGYGSAIVAHQNSYHNCAAIGSTSFTESHLEIIKDLGFQHINFVLDQDPTGSSMMEKYIEKFGSYGGLQVTITNLPMNEEDKKIEGQNDPDYFIRTYGIDAYRKLKPEGLFEHMILKNKQFLDLDGNPVFTKNFVKDIIPLILNQVNLIERSSMINKLAELTKIAKEDIKDEIVRLERTDIRNIKDELSRKIKNVGNQDDLRDLLARSIDVISDTGVSKNDRYLASVGESVEIFDSIFTEMNTQEEGIHGWKTGFAVLDNMLDGIPKPSKGGTAIGFAGAAQHCKSAIMLNLAINLAKTNDDIAICYWAIDDHRKAIAYRLVSMLSGVHMKKVRRTLPASEEENFKIKEAQDFIRHLTATRKLVFKDDRYGRSKSKAETWLKETQDATGKHILFCVDSLHNVQGDAGSETRVKILTTSMWLKSLCASLPATVMTSIELVKNRGGVKPTLQAISESGKVEFDFDTLAIVWNEAQGLYVPVEQVTAKWGIPGNYKPIIELDFQKNKAGAGEKGSVYLQFDTDTTGIVNCLSYSDYMCLSKGPSSVKGPSGTSYNFGRKEDTNKVTDW